MFLYSLYLIQFKATCNKVKAGLILNCVAGVLMYKGGLNVIML